MSLAFDETLRILFDIIIAILIIFVIIPIAGMWFNAANTEPTVIFSNLKKLCKDKNGAFSFTLDLTKYDIHFKKSGSKYKIALYSCRDYVFKRKSGVDPHSVRNLSVCTKVDEFECDVSNVEIDWSKLKCMKYDWAYYYENGCDRFYGEACTPSFDEFSLGDFCYTDSCNVDECYDTKYIQKRISGQFIGGASSLNIKITLVE